LPHGFRILADEMLVCRVVTCMTSGAPRLLQAIAADGVIPLLNSFAVTSSKGEPLRAQLLTATIAECGVLLANVDYIAPIITMSVVAYTA